VTPRYIEPSTTTSRSLTSSPNRRSDRTALQHYHGQRAARALLRATIVEQFEKQRALNHYIDSTAMQFNDEQMRVLKVANGRRVCLVNFDLHFKCNQLLLYAVVTPDRMRA